MHELPLPSDFLVTEIRDRRTLAMLVTKERTGARCEGAKKTNSSVLSFPVSGYQVVSMLTAQGQCRYQKNILSLVCNSQKQGLCLSPDQIGF